MMVAERMVDEVQKRNGSMVAFDIATIIRAIEKAMATTKEGAHKEAAGVADHVSKQLAHIRKTHKSFVLLAESTFLRKK